MKRIIAIIAFLALIWAGCCADEYFVICNPESYVNVRISPKMRSSCEGYVMIGDKVESDGKTVNGFMFCEGLSNESGCGWIYAGYLISDAPQIRTAPARIVSKGRVACRRSVNGQRRKWLKNGQEVTVYALGEEWSITSEGFIMTKYLGVAE